MNWMRARPQMPQLAGPSADEKVPLSGVVIHVVIQRTNDSNLDGPDGCVRSFELKPIFSAVSGRGFSEFGTVRPRVQIPGPRPISKLETLLESDFVPIVPLSSVVVV